MIRSPFTIQDDSVYWKGQLVAKLVHPASSLRDEVEAALLQIDPDATLEELREDYEAAYASGFNEGYKAGRLEGYRDGLDDGREGISLHD